MPIDYGSLGGWLVGLTVQNVQLVHEYWFVEKRVLVYLSRTFLSTFKSNIQKLVIDIESFLRLVVILFRKK